MNYNLRTKESRKTIDALLSKPNAVNIKNPVTEEETEEEETISKAELLEMLNEAFREVKLMMDGKMREIPAEELIYELQNELQHSNCPEF